MSYSESIGIEISKRIAGIKFGPGSGKRCAQAALKVLQKHVKDQGENPEIECFLVQPGHWSDRHGWGACWESGPYQWACEASMVISGGGRLAEPYYGFDLCFYDEE